MKLKGLILGDIRQQYKYGFYALYTLFTLVYITVLRILPMPWKELCTTTLIFSDPVLIGLMFMGAIILFEKSEKVMQALAVSPISVHAYILSKVISIGLISLLSGVLIALFSGMEHSYIHLVTGIMLGSALFTLVGISLSAFISTMNNFMLITLQGDTLFISTMDQEPNDVAGFELGDTVRVNYIEEEEEPGLNTIPTAQKVIVIGKKNRNQ